MKNLPVKRISITGPESTGKSWLAQELAKYYHTVFVPEYSREYLNNIGRQYEENDIPEIAKGQLELEEKLYLQSDTYLFCDTDLIVTKVWSNVKYHRCDPWILQQVLQHRYDFYLLCNIDLPWQPDPLREHPHMRQELLDIYKNELTTLGFPVAIVSGIGESRIKNAVEILNNFFTK